MRSIQAAPAVPESDVAAVVHEELDRLPDRERLPVVLCDLEGLTYHQAAAQLSWTEPTLRHRLVKGRRRLRERLTRRGVTAGMVGSIVAASTARAAVPAGLARAAVSAAAGGTAPAAAVAIASAVIKGMARMKLAVIGAMAAIAIASAGGLAAVIHRGDEPVAEMQGPAAAPPRDQQTKPEPKATAVLPLEGRVVDLEGRPVAGARVEVNRVWAARDNNLAQWLDRAREDGLDYLEQGLSRVQEEKSDATTGPDGRFRLAGIGPDRVAELYISGPTIATAELYATGRDGSDVRAAIRRGFKPKAIVFHSRRFQHAAERGKPIEGFIRDKDTGQPIAGVGLRAAVYDEQSGIPAPGVWAHSDASGHYRLDGLPRAPAYRLFVNPVPGQPYIGGTFRAPADTPAFDPVTFDITLKRGVVVRGQVTDRATGRPIAGYVHVYTFRDNPHVDEFPGLRSRMGTPLGIPLKDGRYELVAAPGHGVIGCRAQEMDHYRGSIGAEAIKGYDPEYTSLPTIPYCNVLNYNVVADFDLDPKAESATVDLRVDPGGTVHVTPVDPEGRPVADTRAAGVGDLFSSSEHQQPAATFAIHGLAPGHPRRVVVSHAGRKLIGSVYLKGDESGSLTIPMQPYGTITGRVVDEEGHPRAGLGLSSIHGNRPKRIDVEGVLPGGDVGGGIGIGRDGRFRVEKLVPGLRYGGHALEGYRIIGELFRDVVVAPGEIKDLGDLKVIPPRRGE